MPYIPKQHEKYDLLPFCKEHGGEVFEYPSRLIGKVNSLIKAEDYLYPYGYKSYEKYFERVDCVSEQFKDDPDKYDLFVEFKKVMLETNCKEDWSIMRYSAVFKKRRQISLPSDKAFNFSVLLRIRRQDYCRKAFGRKEQSYRRNLQFRLYGICIHNLCKPLLQ